MSDIDTAEADSLKVLDLKRPIREADMQATVGFGSAKGQKRAHFNAKLRILLPRLTTYVILTRTGGRPLQSNPLLGHCSLCCRKARYLERVAVKIREVACICRQPETQATKDEKMKIRNGGVVAHNPFAVRHSALDVSEVISKLCDGRTLDRSSATHVIAKPLGPPETPQRGMYSGGNVGHPTQGVISIWRSNGWQQPFARRNVGNIRKDDRRFRDCTVRCCHKRGDATKWINGEIVSVSLPSSFDAHSLIGDPTMFQSDVRSQRARARKVIELHRSIPRTTRFW